MDDVVLKPYPFCGGEAEVYNYYDIYMRDYTFPTDNYIKCKKCGGESGHVYGAWGEVWVDVIDMWNKRA